MVVEIDFTKLGDIADKHGITVQKCHEIFSDVFQIAKHLNPNEFMSTFKDRLLTEKTELNDKRNKLDAFIGSEGWTKINPIQKTLLEIQLQSMATYAECLTQRIAWLEKEEPSMEKPIAGSNGLTVEPDADLDQVVVQGEINLGDPL